MKSEIRVTIENSAKSWSLRTVNVRRFQIENKFQDEHITVDGQTFSFVDVNKEVTFVRVSSQWELRNDASTYNEAERGPNT